MGKGGRENSNGDNDTEDVADADYFADDANDVSGRSSLIQDSGGDNDADGADDADDADDVSGRSSLNR